MNTLTTYQQPDSEAITELYDLSLRDSRSTMDVAVFRLSKRRSRQSQSLIRYELYDGYVEIAAGPAGMATIWDYDIVIFLASYLTHAMNRFHEGKGPMPGTVLQLNTSDLFRFRGQKGYGARQYQQLEASLDRLKSTSIKVDRSSFNSEGELLREVSHEGLISGYRAISHSKSGRMVSLQIEIPHWIYNSITASPRPDVLKLHPNYFSVGCGLERFIYRLAKRAAGSLDACWGFKTIYERTTYSGTFKKFCYDIRNIIRRNTMPEYDLSEHQGQGGPMLQMTHRGQIALQQNIDPLDFMQKLMEQGMTQEMARKEAHAYLELKKQAPQG